MALSRLKDWNDGDILYQADLEAEFDNLYNNGLSLVNPLTAALDFNGFALQGLAAGSVTSPGLSFTGDANTGLYRSAADTLDLTAGGVRGLRVNTATTGVNFLDVTPSATLAAISLAAAGTDANIDVDFAPKGTGILRFMPAGVILPYGAAAAPTGWLLCDGSAVSRTTYARLFAVIATTFGVGDGATTFNVPDLRGRLPLGTGSGTFALAFTANAGTDEITVASQDSFHTGVPVTLTTTGTLPAGLALATTYYVIRSSATVLKLGTTLANAVAGTAIDITDAGTGTHTITMALTARTLGGQGGAEVHGRFTSHLHAAGTLAADSAGAHTHGVEVTTGTGGAATRVQGTAAAAVDTTVAGAAVSDGAHTHTISGSTAATGSTTPIDQMNPYVVLTYIVKT